MFHIVMRQDAVFLGQNWLGFPAVIAKSLWKAGIWKASTVFFTIPGQVSMAFWLIYATSFQQMFWSRLWNTICLRILIWWWNLTKQVKSGWEELNESLCFV